MFNIIIAFTNVLTTVCSWTSCYCGHKRLFLSLCCTPEEMKGHLGPDCKLESHSSSRYAGPRQVMSMLVQDRRPSLGLIALHNTVLQAVGGEAAVGLAAVFCSLGLDLFPPGLPALSQWLHEQGDRGEQIAEASQVERTVISLSVVIQEPYKTTATQETVKLGPTF